MDKSSIAPKRKTKKNIVKLWGEESESYSTLTISFNESIHAVCINTKFVTNPELDSKKPETGGWSGNDNKLMPIFNLKKETQSLTLDQIKHLARKEFSFSSASNDLPIDYRNGDAKNYNKDPEIEVINADISIKNVEKSIMLRQKYGKLTKSQKRLYPIDSSPK